MRKNRIFALVFLPMFLLGFLPSVGLAETSTSSLQVQLEAIAKLNEQIAALKAQLAALQQQLNQSTQEQKENIIELVKTLKAGDRGDAVKTLQALLATDPTIYPEGKITGYFGVLTTKAVKRFQAKHSLPLVGNVGPKTLVKLKEVLAQNPLSVENAEQNGTTSEKRLCAIVPPGHLIAPGWLKKQDNEKPVVPACQILPSGIAKKLATATSTTPGTSTPATTTPDTTAPVISGISATSTASTTAVISWTTNELANSKVYYTASSSVDLGTASNVASSTVSLSHTVNLTGLTASTTYQYVIESKDQAGNTATSSQQSFTTLP